MLEFILQLFGGRGAGSGNKGGSAPGASAAGMTGSGQNGSLTISDLVKSGKTFDVLDTALYDNSDKFVNRIIDAVAGLRKGKNTEVKTVAFTDINKDREVTIRIGWSDGTTDTKTLNKKKK